MIKRFEVSDDVVELYSQPFSIPYRYRIAEDQKYYTADFLLILKSSHAFLLEVKANSFDFLREESVAKADAMCSYLKEQKLKVPYFFMGPKGITDWDLRNVAVPPTIKAKLAACLPPGRLPTHKRAAEAAMEEVGASKPQLYAFMLANNLVFQTGRQAVEVGYRIAARNAATTATRILEDQ